MLQSNWRGEYRSFTDFLNQSRIIFRHSCPYTHHQNGLVERKHKHIFKIRLTLLAHSKLPFKFWWDAFHTIVNLVNRLPYVVLNLATPFKKVFNYKPNYNMLKSFGCACYFYLRDYNKHKFDYHSNKCLFLDYSTSHNGYKCLHPSRKLYIARHVIFMSIHFYTLLIQSFTNQLNMFLFYLVHTPLNKSIHFPLFLSYIHSLITAMIISTLQVLIVVVLLPQFILNSQ